MRAGEHNAPNAITNAFSNVPHSKTAAPARLL
eukprot:COSAG01_NODE_50307_length_364_cov_0.969811_2_plen_31_part_01